MNVYIRLYFLPLIHTQLYSLLYPATVLMGTNTSLGNFNWVTNLRKEESTNWMGKKSQMCSAIEVKNPQIYFFKFWSHVSLEFLKIVLEFLKIDV
jgi:hypothetical protein